MVSGLRSSIARSFFTSVRNTIISYSNDLLVSPRDALLLRQLSTLAGRVCHLSETQEHHRAQCVVNLLF